MNVDKEIAKYLAKRNKLMVGLVNRLNSKASDLSKGIANIAKTITDLNKKKEKDSLELTDLTLKINKVKEDK